MTRIPDAVAVASLETHRLIVTVPNNGPADIASNLPGPVAASLLRFLADHLEQPGRCATAVATGRPCPIHDATDTPPAPLSEAMRAAGAHASDAFAEGIAQAETRAAEREAEREADGQAPPSLADAFANFGTKLRAALEQSAANLAALAEQPADEEQPRRVLAEVEYDAVYRAAVDALGARMRHIGHHMTGDVVDATLAAVGILAPPPEPDGDTCSALFADPSGTWWQCIEDADHDPADGHETGEWSWPNTAPDAIPPRAAE